MAKKKSEKVQKQNLNFDEVDRLYKLFRFEKIDGEIGIGVYSYIHDYFNIIEIFAEDIKDERVENFKKKYSEVGYAVQAVSYKTTKEIHDALYKGFF